MSPHTAFELPGMSGERRAEDGCILSFENAEGKRLVLHRKGPVTKTIGAMCDQALALDPTFRVIAYSTPTTIYTDLTGGRMLFEGEYGHEQEKGLPERLVLQRAGRVEMLSERLALLGRDARVRSLQRDAAQKRRAKKRRA